MSTIPEAEAAPFAFSCEDILNAVRAIYSGIVPPDRFGIIDVKTYVAIVFDSNAHRPAVRIYKYRKKNHDKYRVGIFNIHKVETVYKIGELAELLGLSFEMKSGTKKYH